MRQCVTNCLGKKGYLREAKEYVYEDTAFEVRPKMSGYIKKQGEIFQQKKEIMCPKAMWQKQLVGLREGKALVSGVGTMCIQQLQRGRQEPEIWTFGEHDNEFMFYLK